MISTGIYFTVRSGFFQFRRFGWILKNTGGTILNKKSQKQEDNAKGMLSSFEAISTAIGGTDIRIEGSVYGFTDQGSLFFEVEILE